MPRPPAALGRIWLAFAGAALACALIATLHYRYQGEYAGKHASLFDFQKAAGELTQAVLDVAIAEDGGQSTDRRVALERIIGALEVIGANRPLLPGPSAAADTELVAALAELRGVTGTMRQAAVMDPRSHTRLQVTFATAARLLEARAASAREGMALLKSEQNRLFSIVVVLTLLFIVFGAIAFIRMHRVGQAAERRVDRLTQLYRAQSRINQAVAHARDFTALADQVCRIAVADGGLDCAIVRRHDAADDTLRVTAFHAPRTGLIGRDVVPAHGDMGVSAVAFGQNTRVIVGDIAESPVTRHAAVTSAKSGVGSAAAFPLASDGSVFGTFAVFGPGTGFFDEEMADLLEECAQSLSFAFGQLNSQDAMRESEERYRTLTESAMDAIITCGHDLRIVVFNEAATATFGIAQGEAVGMHLERLLPARFRDAHAGWMRAFHATNRTSRAMGIPGTVMALRADGNEFPTEASISSVEIAGRVFFTVIMRDITLRLASETRITRLASLYAALSRANEAIAREPDWQSLCEAVCRIIVEHGKVVAAVIRMPDHTDAQLLPFAGAGPQEGDIAATSVDMASDHLAARTFRDCRTTRVDDIAIEGGLTPHVAAHLTRSGVRSAIVAPIALEGQPIGVLSVFAAEPGHFDEELARLVDDLAGDLAFAYGKLESEAAIRESETRYRTLVEASPDAIRIICDDRVVMVNPAYERLFGKVPPDQSIDDAIMMPSEPSARGRVALRLRRLIEDRQAVPPDEQLLTLPDGRRIPLEVTSVPFAFNGRPAALTILRDLTEQHARQQALEEAERRYRSLVETSLSGITLLHAGRFEYVNLGLVRLLGFERHDELLGRHFSEVTHAAAVAEISASLRTLEEAPGSTYPRGRSRMLRKDGSYIDIEVAAASLLLEGRIMVLVEIRDVSREVVAQRELLALNRDLEARIAERTAALTAANRDLQTANHDLESFSYSVAHDLRAPLRNMIGFANLLKIDIDEQDLSAAPTHADRVVAGAERMNDLIDGLLAVSRVSHGTLEDRRVDFAAMLAEIVADAAPEERVRFDIGRLPVVNCDASTMRQVWTNLVSNALKYSAKRDEPRVIIAGRPAGDEYVFDVRDNGAGFDPAYADRLFGVFQRLHSSREFEGNGVGLAIVRRIVERHGGRVWAEGSPGAGATFHFSLPVRRIIDTRQS